MIIPLNGWAYRGQVEHFKRDFLLIMLSQIINKKMNIMWRGKA
jgi:hypothetical protein